ncbi:MAG TPA: ribonuclease E/G, partial [Stellaceae bacterium]|nr:ribonuclease E/G [Stellaceae bacterium]
ASPGELRAASVEAGELRDFRLARTVGASAVGEVHLGRVVRLLPALRAALIEIGQPRPAFLGADDALQRGHSGLHEGAAVLVQVKRDARADKAAAVTQRLRLVGHYLDFLPLRPGVIAEELAVAQRERASQRAAELLLAGEGARLHPASLHATDAALAAEIHALRARWREIELRRVATEPPARLEAVSPLAAVLAEFADAAVERIVVDDAAVLAEARPWLQREAPALVERLTLQREGQSLFEVEGIADAVASLGDLRISLAGGGALSIEPTAAATLIDVDSGALAEERGEGEEALLAVDLAAAESIARQIRLRGLAGALVVDFVALRRRETRERLLEAFRGALAREVPEAQLLGWTRLGHVELTRPRRRAALHEILCERTAAGGLVKTALTLALEALAAASRQAMAVPGRGLVLHLRPEIVSALEGEASPARAALERRLGRPLALVAEPAWALETLDIRAI